MAPRYRLKLDEKALRALGGTSDARRVMEERVARVEAAAKSLAPSRSGRYREGIQGSVRKGRKGDWIGSVDATAPNSFYVEFGTRRMRAYAPLRRALESVFRSERGTP